ncbi:hypothetical protein V8D89_004395, partial [Ganoderma adspersum]
CFRLSTGPPLRALLASILTSPWPCSGCGPPLPRLILIVTLGPPSTHPQSLPGPPIAIAGRMRTGMERMRRTRRTSPQRLQVCCLRTSARASPGATATQIHPLSTRANPRGGYRVACSFRLPSGAPNLTSTSTPLQTMNLAVVSLGGRRASSSHLLMRTHGPMARRRATPTGPGGSSKRTSSCRSGPRTEFERLRKEVRDLAGAAMKRQRRLERYHYRRASGSCR